jgi:ribosomal protein L18E
MSKDKIILSSLAMDLKRAALGYHNNSNRMADRFLQEAMKRKREINVKKISPNIKKILGKLDHLINEDNLSKAEDALMYSTLFQNAIGQ